MTKSNPEVNEVKTPLITTLAIQQIIADEGVQPRITLNDDDVQTYKEAIENGADMKPMIVFFDDQYYWLSSGFHRRKAYELANIVEVPVEIRQGTKRDAWLFAKSDNKHGRRYTNEEKRRNIIEMLEDDECRQWSDRKIANHIGVDPASVGNRRKELTVEFLQSKERIGSDGRTINTANIGKKPQVAADDDADDAFDDKEESDIPSEWEIEKHARDAERARLAKNYPPASTSASEPTLAPDARAAALSMYQALSQYGHVGHLFLSAAAAWYELEEARNKFAHAHARAVPKHASGTVFDEWKAFLRIGDPAQWEGCAACKGSTRVEGGELCPSCKGGFTTHVGEGVSADVVAAHAAECLKSK